MDDKSVIPIGLCQCGCGGQTTIPTESDGQQRRKGVPMRFISGHNSKGATYPAWKGGRRLENGYVAIHVRSVNNPRIGQRGSVAEHILVAEKALGKSLPSLAEVHHVDCNRANNANTNLVICENGAYHMLLHQRMRAKAACGNAGWLKCWLCKKYDDPANLAIYSGVGATGPYRKVRHLECFNEYQRLTNLSKRAAAKDQ